MRFSVFYLAGGLVAILAQVVASSGSTVPNLGTSVRFAAVMGAFLVTYPRDRMRSLLVIIIFVRVTFIPAALIVVWFLIQLLNAGSVANVQTGVVAYLGHIRDCIFGVVTAKWFEDPQRVAEQRWRQCVFGRDPLHHAGQKETTTFTLARQYDRSYPTCRTRAQPI